ncbi:MAG: bifunctional riboflavin kinase/FAD synthetase [Dermatophilaceae bacterium]
MQRWNALDDIPPGLPPCVVTLGNFDGVHRGHRVVLGEVVGCAAELALMSVAVTFEPHPLAVLRPEAAPPQLVSLEQRLALLAASGLDAVLVMEFTQELASWSPRRFVSEVFVNALHARLVVVGQDTRFGVRNSGDVSKLHQLGDELGFEVQVVRDQGDAPHAEQATRWSSSRVRSLILAGDVTAAARILGRSHRVAGQVVHGDHRGRELGFPTANLERDVSGLVPSDGVYAGWLVRDELSDDDPLRRLPAAISIGTNPTFDGTSRRVEAYVLDRDDLDLYDAYVSVEFVERLRPTLRFDGIEALLETMRGDVARTREILDLPAGPAVARP